MEKNRKEKCLSLMKNIKIYDLRFLRHNFIFESENNKKGPLTQEILLLNDEEVKWIAKKYQEKNPDISNLYFVEHYQVLRTPKESILREKEELVSNIAYLETFFQDERNILNYEGAYNTFNYIKEYLYECIEDEKSDEENKILVFQDFTKKQEIVKKDFITIAKELLNTRKSIPNAKLAVFNRGLSQAAKKTNNIFTPPQRCFIEIIAFGSTLEKLQNKDYSQAKKLIYTPQSRK